MEKINVAELIKDCPHGMELDSPAYNNLYFDNIIDSDSYPIKCYTTYNGILNTVFFTKYGEIRREENAKCVIFPKGKTTWEGFQGSFKDGDIVAISAKRCDWISIYKENRNGEVLTYVDYSEKSSNYFSVVGGGTLVLCDENEIICQRFATEEEKQKLFQVIKNHGYKWNAETKTVEKLIKPKFKVGDKIKKKGLDDVYTIEIATVRKPIYTIKNGGFLYIESVDKDYELVHSKFDINTLVPFESRVLVRDYKSQTWKPAIFGDYIDKPYESYPYIVLGGSFYKYLIPYEGNEHLRGKTDDCDEYYKTWED